MKLKLSFSALAVVFVLGFVSAVQVKAQTYVFEDQRGFEHIIEIKGNEAVWSCAHCPHPGIVDRMPIRNDEFRSRERSGLSCLVLPNAKCWISRDRKKITCTAPYQDGYEKCVFELEETRGGED